MSTIKCPVCGWENTCMWQVKIKRFNESCHEQTLRCRCIACEKLFEFKRQIKSSPFFDIQVIKEEE